MLLTQTIQDLNDLNLTGMKLSLQQQLEKPKTYDLSFEERFTCLVEGEKSYRQNKKIDRLLKSSKLKQSACLEDVDYQHPRGIRKDLLASLASCQWIKEASNLSITGPTGVGKSWIASALGQQACRKGLSVYYTRLPRLFEELRLARGEGAYAKLLNKFLKTDLLILDDWGLERFSLEQRRDLLEVIEDRHQQKATLITSQIPTQSWHEIIGDPTLADALLDRLLSRMIKLELTGESMRKLKK
jgi:DNA replication protein DnaC